MPKKFPKVGIENDDESDQFDDEVEAYHREKNKIHLDSDDDGEGRKASEEEEVYPLLKTEFDTSSDDDEEIVFLKKQLKQLRRNKFKEKLESDLENDDENDKEGHAESRGWGDKKKNYYGGDVHGNRIDIEDDEGRAVLELEEGLQIAKRHAELMTEEDFMLPQSAKSKSNNKKKKDDNHEAEIQEKAVEKIRMDLTKMSRKEAVKMMEKLFPGYIPLVNDFHAKAVDLKDRILPLMRMLKKGQLKGPGAEYVKLKYHIISNYLSLGAFYMYLVEEREPDVSEHPVIRCLLQFQQFYNRLVPVDKRVKKEMDDLLARLKTGEEIGVLETGYVTPALAKKRKAAEQLDLPAKKTKKNTQAKNYKDKPNDSPDEEEVDEDKEDEKMASTKEASEDEAESDSEEERRKITYQMEKNRGFMTNKPPKKKEKRNPRVKHRSKFRRANIRRKGQVRDFKPPVSAYKGELTGIRAGIIRSRKLK